MAASKGKSIMIKAVVVGALAGVCGALAVGLLTNPENAYAGRGRSKTAGTYQTQAVSVGSDVYLFLTDTKTGTTFSCKNPQMEKGCHKWTPAVDALECVKSKKKCTKLDPAEAQARESKAKTDIATLNSQLEIWKVRFSGKSPGRGFKSAANTLLKENMINQIPEPPKGWRYTYKGGKDGQFGATKK